MNEGQGRLEKIVEGQFLKRHCGKGEDPKLFGMDIFLSQPFPLGMVDTPRERLNLYASISTRP